MQSISYKPSYSFLEVIFGLIGPALIVISIVFPIENMKIGTFWLDLPEGVANAVIAALGVLVTLMTVHNLLQKRALRGNGARIVLDDTGLTFTQARGYRSVPTTIAYDDISKVAVSTGEENLVKLTARSSRPTKVSFDADNMTGMGDFNTLVDVLKRKADNASFSARAERA